MKVCTGEGRHRDKSRSTQLPVRYVRNGHSRSKGGLPANRVDRSESLTEPPDICVIKGDADKTGVPLRRQLYLANSRRSMQSTLSALHTIQTLSKYTRHVPVAVEIPMVWAS